VTDLQLYASGAHMTITIHEVAAYEVVDLQKVDCYEMRFGDSDAACAAATYQKYPYGYYCSRDDNNKTLVDSGYDFATDTYISARYVQVKSYLNNNAF
jgi:hypothetical protein